MFKKKTDTELALRNIFDLPVRFGRFFDQPFEDLKFPASLDVALGKKDVTVKTEIPGMDEKDIRISIKDGVLSITGERKEEKETKEKGVYCFESHTGSFSRSVVLPKQVDEKRLTSSFRNHVLEVKLPTKEATKAKKA